LKWFLACALLAGCGRKAKLSPELDVPGSAEDVTQVRAGEVIETGARWSGGGLCLDIPADWDARGSGNGVLGTLRHEPSGVDITVVEYVDEEPLNERSGYKLEFEDQSAYRTISLFHDGGTRTWTSNEPDGPTLKEWFGTVGSHRVHLEVVLPFGRVIQGTRAVETLFAALKTTC